MDWLESVKADNLKAASLKAVILAGGDVHITQKLKTYLADAELIIAADSGIRHAKTLSLQPHLLVGDFDSISSEDLMLYETVPQVKHQPEKDDLDLELAIQEAQVRGVSHLILVGVTGSRLDQSLAGIMIAAKYRNTRDTFERVEILTGRQDIEILRANDSITLEDSHHPNTFSLVSLVPESILSIDNAKYPLDHARLEFGTGLGISNETLASEITTITLHTGLCVLIVELD